MLLTEVDGAATTKWQPAARNATMMLTIIDSTSTELYRLTRHAFILG